MFRTGAYDNIIETQSPFHIDIPSWHDFMQWKLRQSHLSQTKLFQSQWNKLSTQNTRLMEQNKALVSINRRLQTLVDNNNYGTGTCDASQLKANNLTALQFQCPPRYVKATKGDILDGMQVFEFPYQIKYFWNIESKTGNSNKWQRYFLSPNPKLNIKNVDNNGGKDVQLHLRIATYLDEWQGAKVVKNCPVRIQFE